MMSHHSLEPPEEPAPHTRGILMNWAAAIYDRYCPLIGLGDRFRHETLRPCNRANRCSTLAAARAC